MNEREKDEWRKYGCSSGRRVIGSVDEMISNGTETS